MNHDLMILEVREAVLALLMSARRLNRWADDMAGHGQLQLADEFTRMANNLRRRAQLLLSDIRSAT